MVTDHYRADVKQYIGLPSLAAIFKIYHSCLNELMRVGIVHPNRQILDLRTLEIMRFTENDATRPSLQLRDIARCAFCVHNSKHIHVLDDMSLQYTCLYVVGKGL